MPRASRRFRLRAWHMLAAVFGVILLALTLWLLPRRMNEVALVDDAQRWDASAAPPQRNIVWRPAQRLAASASDPHPDDSLVRPQLAEGGVALYYTVQRSGGSADIYRSQFDGQRWLPGVTVAALNSPADDFGPVISADGQELFLYSDRPGGVGGFDLYVSRRTPAGWSTPTNLGPAVNTPAQEYDPAIAPDGKRLYFSSNRTRQMHEQQAKAAAKSDAQPWKSTLRAEPGLRQFDLYSARRQSASDPWRAIENVASVNTLQSDEGEPYVSPDGAFLYFASDRENEHGQQANFDLYRARLSGDHPPNVAENLGRGVNTAANEHDPSLSPEGFRIVFSSNRPLGEQAQPPAEQYAIYHSQAAETYADARWDMSHLAALANSWALITAILLLLAFLAALAWYLREVSLRRAPLPVFLLLSLLIHLFLVSGSFFVPINGQSFAERVVQDVQKVIAADVSFQSIAQRPQQDFERITEPTPLAAEEVSAEPQPATDVTEILLPLRTASVDTPRPLTADTSIDRTATAAPSVKSPEPETAAMQRRQRPAEEMLADSSVKLDAAAAAAETEQSQQLPSEEVAIRRTEATKVASANPLLRRTTSISSAIERETVPVERSALPAETPRSQPAAQPLERVARIDTEKLESPEIAAEAVAEAAGTEASDTQPAAVDVAVQRAPASGTPANLPTRLAMRSASSSPRSTALDPADFPGARQAAPTTQPPAPSGAAASSSLARQDRVARIDAAAIESIVTDALGSETAPVAASDSAGSPRAEVNLPRAVAGSAIKVAGLRAGAGAGSRTASLQVDVNAEPRPADAPAAGVAKTSEIAALSRRGPASTVAFAEGPSLAITPTPAAGGSGSGSAPVATTGETVQVGRSTSGGGIAELVRATSAGTSRAATGGGKAIASEQGARENIGGAPSQSALAGAGSAIARAAPRGVATGIAESGQISGDAVTPTSAGPSGEGTLPGVAVAVARSSSGTGLAVNIQTLAEQSGKPGPTGRGLTGDVLAKAEVDARLPTGGAVAALDRQRARAPFLLYAQDKIGLQAMLRLRVGDDNQKQDLIDAFGGRKDTLEAIQRGLHWLALVQHPDGHWDLKDYPKGPGGENFSGQGSEKSDTAATGLALLPFLGDGQTHEVGKYQATVAKGIDWLLKNQKEDGDLFSGGEANAHMYSHGIATIAMCEALGMTKDEKLQAPAQRAVDFIVKSQHDEGGWRYQPRERGDTSVVGWQIMALKSAQMAGLNVPQATLDKTRDWLNKSRYGQEGSDFAYQPGGGGTPAMTAEGLLCMEYLGGKRGEPQLMRTVDRVLERVPKKDQDSSYFWYYGTQAMFHMQGEAWQKWNAAMSETLLTAQVVDGPHRGTWDPRDEWEQRGGRIYSTSLRLLMLEVYFRHLPLYQSLE